MFNPLALKVGDKCILNCDKKREFFLKCEKIENFYDLKSLNTARYTFKNSFDFIEVQKDSLKNFKLNYYSLIEKIDFDLTFLSLLGAFNLSYKHPKYHNSYINYQKILYPNEKYETIKVLVDLNDYVLNYINGYLQDANGNWYYLVAKYPPQIKKSINKNRLFWEYKSDKDTILIEITIKNKNANLFQEQPKIYVYEKVKLKRKDIKIDFKTLNNVY